MPDSTYNFGVSPGQGANEEDMANGRKNPAGRAIARVGNYAAPVDTAGMDPAMKSTMGFIRPPAPVRQPAPKAGLFDWLFKRSAPGVNVGVPSGNIKTPAPQPMSQEREDYLSKKYLGSAVTPPPMKPMK